MIQFEMPRQQRYQLVADEESDMPEWAEEYTICNLRSGSDPGPYMFCGGKWVMLSSHAGPQPGMEGRYLYAITTDDAGMNILSVQAGHDGRPLYTVVTASTRRQGAENIPKEWDFVNGVGPFKCWYGAFNIQDYVAGTESEDPVCTGAGMLAYRLDPYDLGTTMGGTTLQGTYNVFLVVPTVYWKAVGNTLYLSDDSSYAEITGMTAYAHTATSGGTSSVYPYIGIGVYEARADENRLLSISGKTPSVNLNNDRFKTLADALTPAEGSDFQQWNLFQWTLYKMMIYAIMGTKNSQWMMGDGPVHGSDSSVTGQADRMGPYAASTNSYDKVLIENSWGSVWQFVGDVSVNNHQLYAGNTLGGRILGSGGKQPIATGIVLPSANGWQQTAYKDGAFWDMPETVGETSHESDPAYPGDYYWQSTGWKGCLVGGWWSQESMGGVSCVNVGKVLNYSSASYGARLSAFFDGTAMGTPEVTTKAAPAPVKSAAEELPEAERDEPAEEPVEEPVEEPAVEESDEGTMDIEGL